MGAARSAICLAMLPARVSGSLDIKYCSSSSSNSNSGSGGGDRELMQQGSGWPAGGDISRSKSASSKPTATAAESERAASSPGSLRLAGQAGSGARTQPGMGEEEKRREAGGCLKLTQTRTSGKRDECELLDAIGVSSPGSCAGGGLLLPEAAQEFFPSCKYSES